MNNRTLFLLFIIIGTSFINCPQQNEPPFPPGRDHELTKNESSFIHEVVVRRNKQYTVITWECIYYGPRQSDTFAIKNGIVRAAKRHTPNGFRFDNIGTIYSYPHSNNSLKFIVMVTFKRRR